MDEKSYKEVGEIYRFFLSWRHAAFAGDLVIMYGVLSLTFSTYKEMPFIACIIPLIGSPVGILLWMIDKRTRNLYHAAIDAGKALEGTDGGFYSELDKIRLEKDASPFKKITQSAALNLLFWGSSLILFILFIVLLCISLVNLMCCKI